MDYSLAVFIGRFQPAHSAHIEVIRQGLAIADRVLVIIGSANAAPNIKNPFTVEERKQLITLCLTEAEQKRVVFESVRDYFYSENTWLANVQELTRQHYSDGASVALLGSYKDSSSYYLKLFPQFDFIAAKNTKQFNATDIRESLFSDNFKHDGLNSEQINWLYARFIGSDRHIGLITESQFINTYKKRWGTAPYAPTFVTTDAVVVQSGHVLLVRRKFEPGRGLLGLPGGFIRESETIEQSAIRELKEETGIKVHAAQLKRAIVESRTFDHPSRSLRGRTITHGFYIRLEGDELPEVRGSDDAASAKWYPLMDLGRLESEFYEDHHAIISYFVNKN